MNQDKLFDNPKPQTRRTLPPAWVVNELVGVHGCNPVVVRSWHAARAFAVLYSMRERKNPALQTAKAIARRRELADRIRTLARDDDTPKDALHDLLSEAFAELDAGALQELSLATSALLCPP